MNEKRGRKKKSKKSIRVSPMFTETQIELIDQLIGSEFGGTRAEIIKQIVIHKLKEKNSSLF